MGSFLFFFYIDIYLSPPPPLHQVTLTHTKRFYFSYFFIPPVKEWSIYICMYIYTHPGVGDNGARVIALSIAICICARSFCFVSTHSKNKIELGVWCVCVSPHVSQFVFFNFFVFFIRFGSIRCTFHW